MKRFSKLAVYLLLFVLVGSILAACGEENSSRPNPGPTPTPKLNPTFKSGGKVISEKDTDTTVQLKVGDTILLNFDAQTSWSFALDPVESEPTAVFTSPTQTPAAPYQAQFNARSPGSVKLIAEGGCKTEPDKICNQALIVYTIKLVVS